MTPARDPSRNRRPPVTHGPSLRGRCFYNNVQLPNFNLNFKLPVNALRLELGESWTVG